MHVRLEAPHQYHNIRHLESLEDSLIGQVWVSPAPIKNLFLYLLLVMCINSLSATRSLVLALAHMGTPLNLMGKFCLTYGLHLAKHLN